MARPKIKPRSPSIKTVETPVEAAPVAEAPAKPSRTARKSTRTATTPKATGKQVKVEAKPVKRRSAAGTFQLTAALPVAVKQSLLLAQAREENLGKSRTDLVHEALNLLFEKHRVPVVDTTTAQAKDTGE